MNRHIIAPSILSADFACLGNEVNDVLQSGADMVHIDVMDNHYVPNLTMGPIVCKALRNHGIQAPLDVHLMIEPVDRIIPDFAKAGATYISFHPEASKDVKATIELIKHHGCKVGLALNPESSLELVKPVINELDLILIMTVNPGFGGQKFMPEMLDKIKEIRQLIDKQKKSILLSVDGGVNLKTIGDIAKAGANMFVAGSAIFGEKDRKKAIQNLRNNL